jgi:hypothetical protein
MSLNKYLLYSLCLLITSIQACNNNQEAEALKIEDVSANDDVARYMNAFKGLGALTDSTQPTQPQKALSNFQIPNDLSMDLVLSEPDIVQPVENNVVTAPNKEETNISEIPLEDLAEVETVTTNATVVVSGMGVAPNNIKMTVNNQRLRMESIVNAIEKYRELLQNEFSVNKIGYSPNIKKLEFFIKRLQQQLALLKESEKEYFFDGKALLLNVSTSAKQNFIVLYEDNYYLKRDSYFYKLTVNTQPQHYIKISDAMLINNLDDILSENGK